MSNPFGPAVPVQQPPAAPPAGPYGQPQQPAYGPPAQPAQPAYAPPQAPAPQPQQAPQYYGQPGQPGSSQWPTGAAPVAPPVAPPVLGGFGTPPAPVLGGDGSGAKIPDMYGRLVLLFPHAIERGLPSKFPGQNGQPKVQDKITATAVVLDDGRGGQAPIVFGGDPTKMPPVPHNMQEPLPYVRKGLFVWQASIIRQIEAWLPGGPQAPQDGRTPGMVLGRIAKDGPERTDPWYLRDATEQDKQLANYYIAAVAEGRFPHPLAQG